MKGMETCKVRGKEFDSVKSATRAYKELKKLGEVEKAYLRRWRTWEYVFVKWLKKPEV